MRKTIKKRSFLQSFTWVGVMLIIMGCVFSLIAIVMQIIPFKPQDISVYHNGVLQPPTQASLRMFRMIFLLVFGTPGTILIIIGSVVLGRMVSKRRRAETLKRDGICVPAKIVEYCCSAMRINRRSLLYLRCAYEIEGKMYIFKSGLLRINPSLFLPRNEVKVYYDSANIRHYYADIDGSIDSEICEI